MGAATAGSAGVFVQTSTDNAASAAAASGSILGQVTAVSFVILSSDRISGKASVPITIGFTPTTPIPIGGTFTLNYPAIFFAASFTSPSIQAGSSSVVGLTGTCGATTSTSVVITTSGAAIAASPFIITLGGFVMGTATAGSAGITVQTSSDTVASSVVHSGSIGGQVTSTSITINTYNRVMGKTGAAATFTFTPTAGGAGPAAVTLNYPSGFFAITPTPTATLSTGGATLAPGAPGATSIVMTAGGTALAASTAVTVTLAGLTMGAATAGSTSVTVQTSADPTASTAVASGIIYGARTNTVTSGNWVYSTVTDVPVFGTGDPKTTHSDFLAIPAFWSLASDTSESRQVIAAYPWSTAVVVLANGGGYRTFQNYPPGDSWHCFGFPQNPCNPYIVTDSQGLVKAGYSGNYHQILIMRPK